MLTPYEKENITLTNRFLTTSKISAFSKANELNKLNTGKSWMVGLRVKDRIAIDIDSHDLKNLQKVHNYYTDIFQIPFAIIKTGHGYHMIQTQPVPKEKLELYRCKVVFPKMMSESCERAISKIDNFFQELKVERGNTEYTLQELQDLSKQIPQKAIAKGVCKSYGNIDILHALLGAMKGYYVIRISKKMKGETMDFVTLEK